MHGSFKKWSFFSRKKLKTQHKYYPASIGTTFNTKFAFDAQVQKSTLEIDQI